MLAIIGYLRAFFYEKECPILAISQLKEMHALDVTVSMGDDANELPSKDVFIKLLCPRDICDRYLNEANQAEIFLLTINYE